MTSTSSCVVCKDTELITQCDDCQNVNQQYVKHPLLSRINTWEQESIQKIQSTARIAQYDLQQILHRFTLLWSKVKMSKDKNAEKINVENTGKTFLVLTLTHRSSPTPSFLFSTFFLSTFSLSTKVGFTIYSSSQEMTTDILSFPSVYGWWEFDQTIINGHKHGCQTNKTFRSGDEITLTLDCENNHILLRHHRTNKFVQHAIDIQLCPLPWKILLRLYGAVSRVRILQ